MSVMNASEIVSARHRGDIVIEPFDIRRNLQTSSYDVRLGEFYYRESEPGASKVFSPYSESHVARVWGEVRQAWPARSLKDRLPADSGIPPDARVILLAPGETILAHTEEFIGAVRGATTVMHARSSLGRVFIETCKCAGWGDVGYVNRWTMEITNNSRHWTIPLVVGLRVAQIVFMTMHKDSGDYVDHGGTYQNHRFTGDVDALRAQWSPTMMLPRLSMDDS